MSFSTDYPYRTVVYLTGMFGSIPYHASGVLVSPDEVLTASHAVFQEGVGGASNIVVEPGYNLGVAPYGSVSASYYHSNPVDDAGDRINAPNSQSDYAIIHLSRPIDVGTMGYESNFPGGAVHVTGYPDNQGGAEIDTTETVTKDPFYSLLDGGDTGMGSSGGPVWVLQNGLPYVVGLVSSGNGTQGYNVQITNSVFQTIQTWISQDDYTNPLVDAAFYRAQNPDVAAALMTPAYHYFVYGWHEGRDPNAYFSTTGYLAANTDVRAAGVNPLSQFDQFGWKEGRDSSVNFDAQLYLAHNADVQAAGLDPLQHYLDYGRSEGRPTYQAIGPAAEIGAGHGFDPEYYLLANPDVARAALGVPDSLTFAYDHYETYGWREGRDPNAWFDVNFYLNAYADVKAAGIDPLLHYDTLGWKEGRDPSAAFNTTAYENAYADVRAAGIDPLLHYLEFGALEGRNTFSVGRSA